MKRLIFGILFLLLTVKVFAADVVVTITIPEHKVSRIRKAMFAIFPKEDGYNDLQWFKKILINYIKESVLEQEKNVRMKKAHDAIINVDDIVE